MVEELRRLADIINDVADDLENDPEYVIASIRLDSVLFHLRKVKTEIEDKEEE